jgi:methionine synthase I (cobalamin-dependent)
MTSQLIDRLVASGPIVTDGAWGTQLQASGLGAGACPDHWNLTHAESVEAVARSYVEAGSQIVLTNTFRANRIALASYDLADVASEISRRGVELSRRAAANEVHVFASIGPSGKMLVAGEIEPVRLRRAFEEQAKVMADAGADAIVVETMAELAEAELAVEAALGTGLPVVACMVFDSGAALDRTMMGVSPEQAAEHLTRIGAHVIGANCGQGIAGYVRICQRLRAATDRPLWIKANAGVPEVVDGEVVYKTTPREFAASGPALVEGGATFIGGCCGTGPQFIRALRDEIRSRP